MTQDIKYIIAFSATVLMVVLFYFGSFLPLQKSQLYIQAISNTSKIRSVQEFNELFNKPLDFYSPVGHGEVVYSYLGVLIRTMQDLKNEQVADALLKEADKRTEPILKEGKGANYFQILQNYSLLYELAGNKFNNAVYYQKASDIYELALSHSPGRINLLYGLFRTSIVLGDKEKLLKAGEEILKQQPNNEEIKKYLQ